MFSCFLSYNTFLPIQGLLDDDLNPKDGQRRPLTPPQSSPAMWGDRSDDSSPGTPWGRSHSSLLHLSSTPSPKQVQRIPNSRQPATTSSPIHKPHSDMARSNAQRPGGDSHPIQQCMPQLPNANTNAASSLQVSHGPRVPLAPATFNSTSHTSKAKKCIPRK